MLFHQQSFSDEYRWFQKITQQYKKYQFNFSEWVEQTFQENFMTISGKQERINQLSKEIESIAASIKKTKETTKMMVGTLSKSQLSFLLESYTLFSKTHTDMNGEIVKYSLPSRTALYNTRFKKNLTMDEFESLITDVISTTEE